MKRALIAAILVCATVAQGAPRQILVLRSEGTADTSSRTSVDTHVLRLAKHLDGKVDAGDITLTDAAAAAGCNPSDEACKDEILMTFAVDEVVTTTVTPGANGQLNITVRRLAKGSAPKSAQTSIPSGRAPDAKLDAELGPLFGMTPSPGSKPEPAAPPPPPPPVNNTPPAPMDNAQPAPVDNAQPAPAPVLQQPLAPEGAAPDRKWQKVGMGVGAGLVVLGIVMWAGASSKQSEIDNTTPYTQDDFVRLRQLEKDADGLAGGGNLFFIGGLVLGGVSAYYYWRKGHDARSTRTARIAPTVFPHGGGLTLTFGGSR